MAFLTQLLQLLVLVSSVSTRMHYYDFYGGSVTFTPKGQNPDGTYALEIRQKQSNYYCTQNFYSCSSGNCGIQLERTITTISSNSDGFSWCHREAVEKLKLHGNQPFEITYPTHFNYSWGRGYWTPNTRSHRTAWRMRAHVDLGIRSDSGESNRSPTISNIPPMRITQNCPRKYNLLVFDRDDDQVRCRFGSASECRLCFQPDGFFLDQKTCTLSYNHTTLPGRNAAFEFMVEDFPRQRIKLSYLNGYYTFKYPLVGRGIRQAISNVTAAATTVGATTTTTTTTTPSETTTPESTTTTSATTTTTAAPSIRVAINRIADAPPTPAPPRPTTNHYLSSSAPLSQLPLQFLIFVDSHHAPSCIEGDYFPIFLAPTPTHGVNLPAFVNRTLEIKVRATAKYTRISDLIVSGPSGTTKHKRTKEEYTITWTPTENEVNDHFTFCFFYEAHDPHNRVYQSELRCLVADVGHHDAIISCNQTSIKVEVEKSYLIKRNEDKLHLKSFSNPACSLKTYSNRTHLVAHMLLNTCGTTLEEDGDNLIFKNEITSADPDKVISRHHNVEIAFSCSYVKRANLTLGFRHKNPYAFIEKGFGKFTFQFEFYESQRFRTQVDANSYPVEVYLKQMIFMQIKATTSIPNTELFVEACRATPYDNPNSRVTYTIIENGCVIDDTVQVYPSPKTLFRFGMEAFEFIGAYAEVYITCSVILCDVNTPGTRCSQGCIRSNSQVRLRRQAAAQTSSHSISQGPLHLVRPSESKAFGPSLSLTVTIVLLGICLLACVIIIFKLRKFRSKYQLLPLSDTN